MGRVGKWTDGGGFRGFYNCQDCGTQVLRQTAVLQPWICTRGSWLLAGYSDESGELGAEMENNRESMENVPSVALVICLTPM